MCRAMEEMRAEAAREAAEKAAREARHAQSVENAKSMLADGLPYETIARYANLPVEEVKALDSQKSA